MPGVAWSFAGIQGQEAVLARLNQEIASNRFPHAYLFEGPAGSGKLTLARALSAELLCLDRRDGSACGACRPCRLLAHANHSDYLELPREGDRLSIAQFVERSGEPPGGGTPLLAFFHLRPVEGTRRIAVVPEAERMGPEAANALLKTLEEPPPGAVLILTTLSRDRLPATIVSRCRRLGLQPLSTEVIAAELAARDLASGPDAWDLAQSAEGSLGLALNLAGPDTLELWRWLAGPGLAGSQPRDALALANAILNYAAGGEDSGARRRRSLAALDLVALSLRQRLRAANGAGARVGQALTALWEAGERITRNVKPEAVLLLAAYDVVAALRHP
ncbi:MAG: hypothetical protein LBU79_01910 [Planctomycetota bacterium]|jgi:DNA polymerase-3 subunit delta'|nr:hypothetical protein [Planctomycetota bacterium]